MPDDLTGSSTDGATPARLLPSGFHTMGTGARKTKQSRTRWLGVAVIVQGLVMAAAWALMFRVMRHSAGSESTGTLMWIMLSAGTIAVLITGLTTSRIMRRHDRELEAINTGLETEVAQRVAQAMSFRDALILGLAKLADYRDSDTGTHLDRIAEYCELLAWELSKDDPAIDAAYIRRLRVASSMHDIGKVGVEDAVLLKPGKLSDQERERMQRHPLIGADTLLAIRDTLGNDELIDMALIVTLEHHERWDGNGYPLGLAAESIQLPARIVALADVYDALTSKRVYKDAMTHAQAAAVIMQGRGTHFDPVLTDAFMRCGAKFEEARARLQAVEKRRESDRPA